MRVFLIRASTNDCALGHRCRTTRRTQFTKQLRTQLRQLIHYAKGADTSLQREVAEKLANEAVKPERQVQIVELGGLELLLPLVASTDHEVQRLAAHWPICRSTRTTKCVWQMRVG